MARKPGLTPQQQAENAEKQRQALELRKAGATFEQIARQLGYANAGGAYKIVQAALRDTVQQPADEVRQLELERLDAMLRALWPAAIQGKWLAVDRCLLIMDRRARLLGLDAPTRRIVEVIDDTTIDREIQRLLEQLAQNDPEPVATDAD